MSIQLPDKAQAAGQETTREVARAWGTCGKHLTVYLLNTHLPPSFGSRLWFSFGKDPLPVLCAPVLGKMVLNAQT